MAQLIDLGKLRFYFAGQYSLTTEYELNDVVKYGGNVYLYTYALATIGNLPTDTDYWTLLIEGVKFVGVYDDETTYKIGDAVAHGAKVYISVKDGTGNTPPNATYWSQFVDGIQYEGTWSDTAHYQKNDMVVHGPSVYIAKQDNTGQTPLNTAYWDALVQGIDATGVYNAATPYKINQLVSYGNSFYRCIAETIGNVPTNVSYWEVVLQGLGPQGVWSDTKEYFKNDIVVDGSTVYIYIYDTPSTGNPTTDAMYWQVLTSGITTRGDWAPSTQYYSGDVVTRGGSTYITSQFHASSSSFGNDLAAGKWTKYNGGVRYRGAWADGVEYLEGDIVTDGENARIATADHTSSPYLIDDEAYWDILAKGATGLLPAQGGRAGYVLTTDGAEASFERDVTNLYLGDGARTFIEGPAALTDVAFAAAWDSTSFAQSIVVNNLDINAAVGAEQSADFIAYTSGSTNDAGWSDIGFTGPEFNSATYGITGPSDGYVFSTAAAPKLAGITNKVLTGNVATITTDSAHGFVVGKTVDVSGVDATFNGRHVITSVTTNTFSFAKTHANVTSASATGTAKMYIGAGNLVLATGDTGYDNKIVIAAGGFASGNRQLSITPDENVHIEIATASTSPTTGALTVVGGVGVTGDQYIQGNLTVIGNVDLQGVTKLPVGAGATAFETSAGLTNAIVIAAGTSSQFVQNAIVNLGTGISSSADYLAYAGEGDNETGWIDLGITNASFNDPTYGVTGPHDGYVFMSAPAGTTGAGNLVIATDNTGTDNWIVFAAGGLGTGNQQMWIVPNQEVHIEINTPSTNASTGALTVVGGVGIAGQLSFDGLLRTKGQLYFGDGAEAYETAATLTNARVIIIADGEEFAQVAIHNPEPTASTDLLLYADNGDDETGWIDIGITGSAFSQPLYGSTGPNDGYIFYEAPLGTAGEGNLVFATGNNGTANKIIMAAGGFGTGTTQMEIIPDQEVHIEIATPSISPTTGALTVVGGVGVLGDMNIAGDVNISGQISFAGGGTTVTTENLAVTDPMIFTANGQLIGDNVDFAFLGQSRSQRVGTTLGPFTLTNKSRTSNVATLVTGAVNHGFEVGDTVVVNNVDTLTTYKTAFPIIRARATENVTTNYVKNVVLVSRSSNVATITVDSTHNYLVSESVTISGADTGYNGTFTITAVTSNTFSFANTGADDSPNVSAGTTTVSRTVSTTFVTLTTSTAHNFNTGETVVVQGVATAFNGTFTIYDVPSSTTFRYVQSGTLQTPTSTGGSAYVAVSQAPIFNGTQTITAVPTSKSFSFASTGTDITLGGTIKETINYVTAWSITNGTATLVVTNPPTEPVGASTAVQNVHPSINDTIVVTAVNAVTAPYTLSFTVALDDVPSTTLVTTTTKSVTSRNRTSNVATLTTSTPHGFIIGQEITVAGVSASFNGTFIVSAIPASDKFSYAQVAANVTETASTGTASYNTPNPGTTTYQLTNQGTATVTNPYRGSYSGLARNHSTGEWSIISGIQNKPTTDIPWTDPLVVTNTLNIKDLKTTGDVYISGGDLVSTTASFNLLDPTVTSLNFARTATTINMGANSGTLTIGNPTIVGTQTTQNLWNTVATTVNAFGAATAITVGAATGSVVIQNPLIRGTQTTQDLWNTVATTANFLGAATTINMGASGGTLTLRNNTVVSSDTTVNLWNTVATTVNAFGAATTVNAGVNTLALTMNIASGVTASGNTKAINIGTSAASGATTNITLGSATSGALGTTTINGPTVVLQTEQSTDFGVATKRYADMRPTIITGSQAVAARTANTTGSYQVNNTAAVTLTLPASAVTGDRITIADIANSAMNNITVARNGLNIAGLAENLIIDVKGAVVNLVYSDATNGWRLM